MIMSAVASILKGNTVASGVSLLINPGSRQVYEMLSRKGLLSDMISAGARILECSCGPCIGMGGAPGTGNVSIRSYNRNFRGRSGNKDAFVYLASAVSCAVFAVKGEIVDPRLSGLSIQIPKEPRRYIINDNMIIKPKEHISPVEIVKGPNIKDVPVKEPLEDDIEAEVLLKVGDNITTDDIMPAGSQILPLRSNIPAISEYVFSNLDNTFSRRAKEKISSGGIIVGGENYGQGSSREHAAIAPMFLGVKAVIAKSFARIHRSNLINFGIMPLQFRRSEDYDMISQGDKVLIENVKELLKKDQIYIAKDITKDYTFELFSNLNDREKEIIIDGGLLPHIKKKIKTK